jgi:hypothetical protein
MSSDKSHVRRLTKTNSLIFVSILAAVLLLGVSTAHAQIPAGTDCWETDAGTMAGFPPLPAGFFFPGSDPRPAEQIDVVGVPLAGAELADCGCKVNPEVDVVWVDIHLDPVEPDWAHRVTQIPPGAVDSCVARTADADFPGGVGTPVPIPIELVQLHLESVVPIVVTGPGPNLWNVRITEDGVQPLGQLILTPATLVPAPGGAMTMTSLPIQYQIEFLEVGGPGIVTLGGLSLDLQNSDGNFQSNVIVRVPVMSPAGQIALVLVMSGGLVWFVRRRTQSV